MTDTLSGSITREGQFAVIRVPLDDVHALRVALEECPCKHTKSIATQNIRKRLSQGLGRLAGRS